MGYAHGFRWDETLIERAIKDVVEKAKIDCFPTHSLIKSVTGNCALTNAISKNGGSGYWAKKLGLEIKKCESRLGEEYELDCQKIVKTFGYKCEKMPIRYPYDLLIEDSIKVEVKCGNLYHGVQGDFYTFNLEKSKPTCDLFVCYCLNKSEVQKVYIIPASILSGKTQLSIGQHFSKYDPYINRWDYIHIYVDFYQKAKKAVF